MRLRGPLQKPVKCSLAKGLHFLLGFLQRFQYPLVLFATHAAIILSANSMNRRAGIDAKIERAEKHISDLDAWRCGLGETKPYTILSKPHPIAEIAHTTLYVEDIREIDASLLIGDCVHNLRSALDHLAWQLVEAGGGTPNKDTFFPLCERIEQYAPALGKGEIHKMREGAKELLRKIQRWESGDDTLWFIHELDRIDKHRILLTAMLAVEDYGVDLGMNRIIWLQRSGESFPLVRGYEIVNMPTSTFNQHSHEDIKLSLHITFGQPKIVQGKSVLPLLNEMAELVLAVVDRFGAFLI